MSKTAELNYHQDTLFLSGELDFSNAMSLYEKGASFINQLPELQIDFSGLTSCNSAVLALMIEWIKFAKSLNKSMHFSHLSTKLISIAAVAGMDHLLV